MLARCLTADGYTETANPLNELQLLTDIAVSKNNKDDSKILEDRTDKITKKTPDLEELHTDGGYGSKEVDDKMEDNNINLITTAVKCNIYKNNGRYYFTHSDF